MSIIEKLGITPGPWFRGGDGADIFGYAKEPNDARHIADCQPEDSGLLGLSVQDVIDARLIAAAPEMLEALELAIDILATEYELRYEPGCCYEHTIQVLRETPTGQILRAVEKATDRTWKEIKELLNEKN